MSGPIVRKYGFPNFEKIFGERPLKHGEEVPGQPDDAKKEESSKTPPGKDATPETPSDTGKR